MAVASVQRASVGPSTLLLSSNSNYCPVHVSVIKFTRIKSLHRCSGQRRRARALTRSALVEANKSSVPLRSDKTGKSGGSSKSEVIQYTGDAVGGGGNSVLAVAKSSWNRADDMQAEARAMARAACASVYSPEMLANKYGSRPIMVDMEL